MTGLSQAFTSRNVLGTNNSTLTVTAYTVNDGNGGADYTVTTHTATGTITPAALSISAVTDSKTYDSTTTSSKTPTVSGLLGSDTVTGLSQAFTSKNVLGTNNSTLTVTAYTVNDGNGGTTTGDDPDRQWHYHPGSVDHHRRQRQQDLRRHHDFDEDAHGRGLFGSDPVTGLSQAFTSKDVLGTNGSTLVITAYTINDGNGGARLYGYHADCQWHHHPGCVDHHGCQRQQDLRRHHQLGETPTFGACTAPTR